jgi:hypothetical protein
MVEKKHIDNLEAFLPKYPNERKEITKDLISDVLGEGEEKRPNIRSLKQARKGDLVRFKGQDVIFIERTQATRQGREATGITVLKEIEGEAFVCSYFEEDISKE